MKREDKVYTAVKELSKSDKRPAERGFSAQEIADYTGLDRGNVSRELNSLVRKGKLAKRAGRPVRFVLTEENSSSAVQAEQSPIDPFGDMIGQYGSLKIQIKQAKAAILYPSSKLHTLITGSTGTGKTTFARKMFEYAVFTKTIGADKRFVTFNCAEYADNPSLIVSQLFGYKKGAFTGAQADMPGLIDEADGGVLFLDEIHRLPPEGQEMLFTLIDYGIYRRLGETDRNRKADVLIIGATTENVQDSLLKTFLRRMPVVIQLPTLTERPAIERLQFIELFFSHEQKNMSVPLRVSREVIISLMRYDCPWNVGQLKADIQLLCARAFWEYRDSGNNRVDVSKNLLPVNVEQGLYRNYKPASDLVNFLNIDMDSYDFVYKEALPAFENDIEHVYGDISRRYYIYNTFQTKWGVSNTDSDIFAYINSLIAKHEQGKQKFNEEALLKFVDRKVFYAVRETLEFAEIRLGRELSDKVKIGFLMHVNSMQERRGKPLNLDKDNIQRVIAKHPVEYKVAKLIARVLEEELNINIDEQEQDLFTMFLCADYENDSFPKVGVVVLAHGESTATSLADTANRLLNINHCKSIDMPLDQSVETTFNKAKQLTIQIDEGRGVLFLVDMGSLNTFSSRIEEETGIRVMSVGMVSTLMVIEAVRRATLRDADIKDIVRYLNRMAIKMFNQDDIKEWEGNKSTIVVTCVSGMGAALKIGEIVKEIAGINETHDVRILHLDMSGKDCSGSVLSQSEIEDVIAVVGTVDLKLNGVPFISVDELVLGDGICKIEEIVQGQFTPKSPQSPVDQRIIVSVLREMLAFLDAEKVCTHISEILESCTNQLGLPLTNELAVRFVLHVACMIERLIRGEILPYKDMNNLADKMDIFEVVKKQLHTLRDLFNITIPDTEVAYVTEILAGQ
jgi:transcriptional regulatory protein LevR/transcriptional regulator with AAA-type ATPase domain